MRKYRCVVCDGSGQVHNHNPKCWDCKGTGETDRQTAESTIRSQILPEIIKIKWLVREQFGKDEQDSEVARLLELR
jgi:hypothetical protein